MENTLSSQALAELNEVLWTLPASLDPQEIVAVLLERCTRLFDAPLAAMWVGQPQGFELAGVFGFTEKKAEQLWQKLDLDQGARTCQLDGQELHALGGFGKRRLGSLIAVPLQAPRGVAGWLVFARLDPAPFTDLEKAFLEILANRVASFLDNARQYQETQARSRELELLNEISSLLASTTRLDELLDRLVVGMVETLDLSACLVSLIEPDGQSIRVRAAHSREGSSARELEEYLRARPVRLDEGRTGQAYRTGRPVFIPCLVDEQVTPADIRARAPQGSMLILPLLVRGEFLGAVYLARGRGHALSEVLLPLATHVANQVAVAIANARLYQTLEQKVADRTADIEQQYEELARWLAAGRDFFELLTADLQEDLTALEAGLQAAGDDPRLAEARGAASRLAAHLGQLFSRHEQARGQYWGSHTPDR